MELPALMTGVFRSADGELGIFMVNVGSKDMEFKAELDPARYGMPADVMLNVHAFAPDGTSQAILANARGTIPLSGSLSPHHITMFRVRAAAR